MFDCLCGFCSVCVARVRASANTTGSDTGADEGSDQGKCRCSSGLDGTEKGKCVYKQYGCPYVCDV